MAPDFKTYLATQIVSEQTTVSYRSVSRALKVHVNAAKCMLYEYYEQQKKKKPQSIHATYLIAGTKRKEEPNDDKNAFPKEPDQDVPMPSSPPLPDSVPMSSQPGDNVEERFQVSVKTITLVGEEKLQEIKEQYESITSIHIYSISPARLQDLQALTDVGSGLFTDVFSKEDPLIHNKTYGVIQNASVRRRKGNRPVNVEAPTAKFQPVKDMKSSITSKAAKATTVLPAEGAKKEETSRPSSRDSTSTQDSKKPSLKRDGSSLFKAFAKQQNKPKIERKDTETSASAAEDTKMINVDDDEGESEDEAMFLDTNTKKGPKKRVSEVKKEREDKQAKLRKMMESDDEDQQSVALPDVEEATGLKAEVALEKKHNDDLQNTATTEGQDLDEVAWSDSDTERQRQSAPGKDVSTKSQTDEIASTDAPKRRRGKRKVMKKRTMKDEDGYLVTKEEEIWESFSEDEPEPRKGLKPKAFPPVKSQNTASKNSAGKATGGGTGTGGQPKKKPDIMSFFGKR